MTTTNQSHWEQVYKNKSPREVSWTQEKPQTSLDLIHSFGLDKSARIIDVGGGDSRLADFLLDDGYEHITVLDISAKALEKAKARLGERAQKIKWIVSDITEFETSDQYDIWHDRATFHFLTTKEQIDKYIRIAENKVTGFLSIGTFSENGPEKCSGLTIRQYTESSLAASFEKQFGKLKCITEDHVTPFGTKQNFLFCSFRKK
jgi:ubiquinone/menaquinone biosynthesis C-methylase UbiE